MVVTIGDLTIDLAGYRVSLKGGDIDLTSTEFRFLAELAKETGRVLTTDDLLDRIWGRGYEGEEHLVWKVIHRLRQKIEEHPKNPVYIHTKPGIGYLLEKHKSWKVLGRFYPLLVIDRKAKNL